MTLNAKTVVITGAGGKLGLHCRVRLQFHRGFDVFANDEISQRVVRLILGTAKLNARWHGLDAADAR